MIRQLHPMTQLDDDDDDPDAILYMKGLARLLSSLSEPCSLTSMATFF